MSNAIDNDKSDEIDFSWGIKRGRGGQKKEVQFYESFTYDGVEYFLYDSVYLFKEGETKPYIGKLIKIWEHSNSARKVKVLWFFYPSEISNYIKGENVLENELFLASGVGKGLANINPLEAIAGKCNAVCISKDERNQQPSVEELKMAHYVFYRTFDVQNYTISDELGEKIAMIEVNLLLNKKNIQLLDRPKVDSGNVSVGVEKPLIAVKGTLAVDGAAEHDATTGSLLVKNDRGSKRLLDNSNYQPVGSSDATEPDNTGLVTGRETNLVNKDPGGANEIVECDAKVGSLVVKDDKWLKGKGNAAGAHNLGPVSLPATEVSLASSEKLRIRSPDSKQSLVNKNAANHDLNSVHSRKSIEGLVPPVTAADSRKSKQLKDNNKAIAAVAKDKSDDKRLKKLKIDGVAPRSSDDCGTSTAEPATVATNKASQSAGAATDNDRGWRTKELDGLNNGVPGKLKSDGSTEDKSDGKPHEVFVKQSKDKQGSAVNNVAANKTLKPANGDAETESKANLSKKMGGTSNGFSKKRKSNSMVEEESNNKLCKVLTKKPKDEEIEANGCVKEVTQRPPDRSKWFTASPWEDRMKDAHEQGRLVLLKNLDPTYTSTDVENIVWHAFDESCTAKMVQHTAISSRRSGQAFVIFKTQVVADKILKRLEKECLMLPNGRPIVGSRQAVCFHGKHSPFPGHLVIDKLRHQLQRETREAVSTSHSSQPNTLEYEMAIEWRLLQDRSELWWKMLYKRQEEQIRKMKESLKSK
ncbi:protein ANTI-SILENCING 1 [Beta vulgaris subsp. vulgaris]|uniref:protein ANTI-SILENCING 1 n=1 Tax=Beta vulgaris subsp. vulgaris TaxID=3555 RepID=UPI002037032B|nr:protein ANTI-SILENCING 1 [Beta vulgaris subsp. vulgaris]